MTQDTYSDRTVIDGVVALIVPAQAWIYGALKSAQAQALFSKGARFYTLPDGGGMLSLRRPPGGIPTAICLRDIEPDCSPSEVTPCAA